METTSYSLLTFRAWGTDETYQPHDVLKIWCICAFRSPNFCVPAEEQQKQNK